MGAGCSRPEPRSLMDRILDALADPPARGRRQQLAASRRRRSASPQSSAALCRSPRAWRPRRTHAPAAGTAREELTAARAWEQAHEPRRLREWGRHVASPVVSDYAAVSTQNSKFRKRMEDECVAIPHFRAFGADPAESSFFGVYDGHGGDFCSKYAAKHLHRKLAAALEQRFGAKRFEAACSSSGASADTASSSLDGAEPPEGDVFSSEDMARCWAEAFSALDRELGEFDESASSGSTAVTCLIRKCHGHTSFHVANVGDSRAVLFAGGRTTRLTVDHKATNEDEARRIRALNGIIVNRRVAGCISVTRALGQADEKRFITSAPHVASVGVDASSAFLMLVSDGVSDAFSDEELTAFIGARLRAGHAPLAACKELLDEAKQQGSMDNMTAVLIRFGD